MALTSGTRLGPYEIESPLGAGGMGEVYRARDTRLERTVAIKVLNAQLVASAELRARFEREAKVISQLQHPNICVLHDVGNEGPIDYLVMEFLQGESLAERLRKGPLPPEQVLNNRHRNCRRARKSPPRWSRPSRPEAGQRDAYQVRRQASRFRSGQAAQRNGRLRDRKRLRLPFLPRPSRRPCLARRPPRRFRPRER